MIYYSQDSLKIWKCITYRDVRIFLDNLTATLPKYYIFGKFLKRRLQKVTAAVHQCKTIVMKLLFVFSSLQTESRFICSDIPFLFFVTQSAIINTVSSVWFKYPIHNHCVKSVQIWSSFWSVFSRLWTKYGEAPYSVQMRENVDQKQLRIWTFFTQC